MTTVFLHIGMPKCASTSVQGFFHRNDELHRKHGTCYPRSYREKSGYFSHRPLHHPEIEDIDQAVRGISIEAHEAKCSNILLSSEEFLNSLWDNPRTRILIEALNKEFGKSNVRIISLLRNQIDFVESTYAQFLRAGMFRVNESDFFKSNNTEVSGFMEWFRNQNGFDFYSYSSILEKFKLNAPDNPFDAYSIERPDQGGRDIMEVLCSVLELPAPNDKVPQNKRLTDTALLLARYAMPRYGVKNVRSRINLIMNTFAYAKSGFSPVLQLSGEALDSVLKSAEADSDYLKKNFSGSFDCLLSRSKKVATTRATESKFFTSAKERALVDYIMCAKDPSLSQIERVKVEFGLPSL